MPAFKQENLCKSVRSVGKKLHSVKYPTDCTDFHRCFLLTYASLRSSKRICVNLRNLWAKTPQRKVSHRLHRFSQMFSDNIRKSAFKQENLCKSVKSVGKKLHSVKYPTDCTDFHRCFLTTYASLRSSKKFCVNL